MLRKEDSSGRAESAEPQYEGGLLSQLNRQAVGAASKNRQIASELARGRVVVGEYYAKLAIDQIFLAESYTQLQQEHEALCKKEQQLEKRLSFLFEDSKRLSHDNDAILKEGKEKDKLLSEMYLQLELQSSKYRGSKRHLSEEQSNNETEAETKIRTRGNWRKTQKKLIEQHHYMWVLQDEIEYLKVEVASHQALIKKFAAEPKDVATFAMQRRQSILDSGSPSSPSRQAACEREDCVMLRKLLKDVTEEIKRHSRRHRTVRILSDAVLGHPLLEASSNSATFSPSMS